MIDIKHKDIKESNVIEIDGIEFVKVVRCKECIWSEHMSGFLLCGAWEARAVDDNDFCSYGERLEK